ncbi:MAG TPA: hypothetical protein VNF02_04270 [Candidatus Limnocylindrales bacterium]|nr:hypothetical protein [Candidatus Limnocylindrales bacterium]
MRRKRIATVILALGTCAVLGTVFAAMTHAQERPDFLSPAEAEKIRDAQNPNRRVELFLDFAADRIKKLQYELQLKSPQMHKSQILNGLLSGYSGCIDEADDRIQEGRETDPNMRPSIKDMQKRAKEYLAVLQKIKAAGGPEMSSFHDALDDAIDGTQDALKDASSASKEFGAVPVRRKP